MRLDVRDRLPMLMEDIDARHHLLHLGLRRLDHGEVRVLLVAERAEPLPSQGCVHGAPQIAASVATAKKTCETISKKSWDSTLPGTSLLRYAGETAAATLRRHAAARATPYSIPSISFVCVAQRSKLKQHNTNKQSNKKKKKKSGGRGGLAKVRRGDLHCKTK